MSSRRSFLQLQKCHQCQWIYDRQQKKEESASHSKTLPQLTARLTLHSSTAYIVSQSEDSQQHLHGQIHGGQENILHQPTMTIPVQEAKPLNYYLSTKQ